MRVRVWLLALGLLGVQGAAEAQGGVRYGANPQAGATFVHDGVKLYYETYGQGEPLLLIHGNGGSIADFSAQIAFFRVHYRVIAMDSRDHGRSADSVGTLNYEKMTGDQAALLEHLHAGPAYVLGWSDGGIEALELGYLYPRAVKKIAAMAANLVPEGLTPETLDLIRKMTADAPQGTQSTEQQRELKVTRMMLAEPQIAPASLEKIEAPTLVLASDHDLITDEHTLAIYHHIPHAELAIFPGATHMIPYDDPARFDEVVERFFTTPYVAKDRVGDVMKSLEAMKAAQAKQ